MLVPAKAGIGVRGLLNQALQAHHLVCHRCFLVQVVFATRPITGESSMTAREAAGRYSASWERATGGFATTLLHHYRGHDLR
jgi:hypothetical protein